MRAEVSDWYTDIFLTPEEVTEHCKPGTEEACVWLVAGSEGFECTCMHKPLGLLDRWEKGLTRAKRDGCEKVNAFDPSEHGEGIVEF